VLFCEDPELASCVANKGAGIRAAAVSSVAQATRAVAQLGANVLVVEMAGRTFFEFKALLGLAGAATCPDAVACTLTELDGHAHR
jgi:ribose 5-phosphate isomerase RpiB